MGLRLARLDVCHLVCLVQRLFDSWDPSSTDSSPNDIIENMMLLLLIYIIIVLFVRRSDLGRRIVGVTFSGDVREG